MSITRIPDGCRRVSSQRLIQVQSPWDWVLTYRFKTALIDTKTVQGDSFAASAVKDHQLDELLSHGHSGAFAGYVIWFRKPDQVFYIPAKELSGLKVRGGSFHGSREMNRFLYPNAVALGSITQFDPREIMNPPSIELECD